MKNKFKFGKKSKSKLETVHSRVQSLANLALSYSTVDFSIIDGFRTTDEQKEMFKKGASELDGVKRISDHQTGMAIDVLPYVKGMNLWDVDSDDVKLLWLEVYRAFMRAGMKLGVELEFGLGYNISGGRDWPHISVKRV